MIKIWIIIDGKMMTTKKIKIYRRLYLNSLSED